MGLAFFAGKDQEYMEKEIANILMQGCKPFIVDVPGRSVYVGKELEKIREKL